MTYLNTLHGIVYQAILLILLTLGQSYFYRGKNYRELRKTLTHKLLVSLSVGLLITPMYGFNISFFLSIFILILPLNGVYVGFISTFFIYIIIVLNQIIFNSFHPETLIFYLIIILIAYFSLKDIKSMRIKLILVFFFSFFSLNIELGLFDLTLMYFLIYNLSAIIVWGFVLYLTDLNYYKNRKILENQKKIFIDKDTKTNNYYSLLNRSYQILKDKKACISFILINIDRLKDINKLYGKSFGDQVIRIVADTIKDNINDYGQIFRLDGDTFCVIAINEKFKMMQTISERIRLDIVKKDLIVENNKINLSVSIGGYYGKIDSKNIDDYIEVANDSLLNSKYHGRNRVILNNQMVYYPKIL